ncbi:transporter substrate-binding domain-containing protein [Pseudodesulfovibrio sp. zrk46]|uniref:transporter substrate-binding domain-containing protein n=1 Tax=Pseudodesulfovibrio sp. zrk46 TaxID=2725288 RepID=UPI001449502F|nr:transporter substrate-binding domain-containing protein [Pseudodesulfovibrio sp. zrk46]QJB55670.1 transporter substrate-binding domain-containing protein [Pseudodesulfovibrio sp. zrk46]
MTCLLFLSAVCSSHALAATIDPSLELTFAEKRYLMNKGELTYVCDPNWLPYERINLNGEHEGVAADYMNLLSERLGVPFRLIPTKTWAQSVLLAKAGKCDLVTMLNKTPEREEFLDFTEPYFTCPVILMRPEEFSLESLDDLHGKTVAVVKGYRQEEEFQRDHPEIKLLIVKSSEDGILAVKNGKAAASVATLVEAYHFTRVHRINELKPTKWAVDHDYHRVGVRKNDPLLLSIMRKAVSSLTEEDRHRVEEVWISVGATESEKGLPRWVILFGVGGLVVIFAWLILARKAH